MAEMSSNWTFLSVRDLVLLANRILYVRTSVRFESSTDPMESVRVRNRSERTSNRSAESTGPASDSNEVLKSATAFEVHLDPLRV